MSELHEYAVFIFFFLAAVSSRSTQSTEHRVIGGSLHVAASAAVCTFVYTTSKNVYHFCWAAI